jgi:hypothetical protein
MIRKIGAALAIAAGALAAAGVAAPANASNGDKIIDSGEVIVWKDANFVGQFYDFGTDSSGYPTTAAQPAFGTGAGPTGLTPINDNTSSIANYSSSYVQAFVDGNYMGAHIQLLPYESPTSGGLSYAYSSLGTLDNQLSSHKVAGP